MTPSGSMFRVASNNASVRLQLDVKFVHHVSTVSRSHLPYLSCFFSGLTSAPLTSFMPSPVPARSCPALSYSVMFYSQVLLRRLHGSCAHVCACLCLYACVFLRPCRPCGVNPPTCSGCIQTALEPHLLQRTTAALQVLHSIRTSGACHTYTEVHRSKLLFNSLGKFA